jgi:hypothetical protein
MITLFQLQQTDTKEVLSVDSFVNCQALCTKVNCFTKKISYEIVPASLASISKFDGGCFRKPIFSMKSIDDIRMADVHSGIESSMDDNDDEYTNDGYRERKVVYTDNYSENNAYDWKQETAKEKVAAYLAKFKQADLPKTKKKKKSIKKIKK